MKFSDIHHILCGIAYRDLCKTVALFQTWFVVTGMMKDMAEKPNVFGPLPVLAPERESSNVSHWEASSLNFSRSS